MTQVLTVPTHFNDIGELSEGFLDRVEQDTLILYGPVPYEDGSEIEFAVLLADGTAAIEGVGRIRAAVDGGDDRVPETRYDIVVEALELDGRSEVVFERLVIARQAVSEPPDASDDPPAASEMAAEPDEDVDATDDPDVEMVAEEVESFATDEGESFASEGAEPETVPPEASDEDEEEDSPTVVAAVDAEAIMAEAEAQAAPETESEAESPDPAPDFEPDASPDAGYEDVVAGVIANANETQIQIMNASDAASADEGASASEPAEGAAHQDSMYAFEHGIAQEPRVGMPVPMPSMAAPPDAPPAPPTLRLAEPPDGLTRPSLAQEEESLFTVDGEVSDVHSTGLFAYEGGLPIPSRPPLPDPNRAKKVEPVEAANDYDVEESEPPELLTDDYEEVRLSDFAEAVEEG